MSTSWPNAVQRFFDAFPSSRQDPVWPASRIVDTLADTVEAIQVSLGTAVRGTAATVAARIAAIEANGWVTNTRLGTGAVSTSKIADGQVTDAKMHSVSWTKITTATDQFYFDPTIRSTGHIIADGYVQGYDGVKAGSGGIGTPAVFFTWVRALTNGSGAATIAHNIPSLQRRVLTAEAWFRGAGGEARNLLPTGYQINGDHVIITGAPANTRCRVGITYMADVDSDWA